MSQEEVDIVESAEESINQGIKQKNPKSSHTQLTEFSGAYHHQKPKYQQADTSSLSRTLKHDESIKSQIKSRSRGLSNQFQT